MDKAMAVKKCEHIVWVPTPYYTCKICNDFTTAHRRDMEYHMFFTETDNITMHHSPYFTPPTYRCHMLLKSRRIEDFPFEILINILKLLHESDRRRLKQTCRRLHTAYITYIQITKANPPMNLTVCARWIFQAPCNALQLREGPLHNYPLHPGNKGIYIALHECICTYHRSFTF